MRASLIWLKPIRLMPQHRLESLGAGRSLSLLQPGTRSVGSFFPLLGQRNGRLLWLQHLLQAGGEEDVLPVHEVIGRNSIDNELLNGAAGA